MQSSLLHTISDSCACPNHKDVHLKAPGSSQIRINNHCNVIHRHMSSPPACVHLGKVAQLPAHLGWLGVCLLSLLNKVIVKCEFSEDIPKGTCDASSSTSNTP